MQSDNNSNLNHLLSNDELLEVGQKVFELESSALEYSGKLINQTFLDAVKVLYSCKGKTIITGLGKSGIAGKKIAATLSSTGMPSLFLHAGEAGHGDLGVVSAGDVVIALSYSGETHEVVEMIPRFKLLGVPVIALTGNVHSGLGEAADVVVDVSVKKYPWPYGLLPTASNAVTVAMGDAFAIALLMARGVREEDFASLHPGGLLGRKMLVKVRNLMHSGEELPMVPLKASLREVLVEITAKRLGVACVVDNGVKFVGIITDGDVRRLLETNPNPLDLTADSIMTSDPKTTTENTLSATALHEMEALKITSLPVVSNEGNLTGLVHIHDILKLEINR